MISIFAIKPISAIAAAAKMAAGAVVRRKPAAAKTAAAKRVAAQRAHVEKQAVVAETELYAVCNWWMGTWLPR